MLPWKTELSSSIATTDVAIAAMAHGARLITHLFNAMPQLHHRDPSIIGLLGASPHLSSYVSPTMKPTPSVSRSIISGSSFSDSSLGRKPTSEAFDELETPPQSPLLAATLSKHRTKASQATLDRPFYELIVDGIHSHPNSVRLAYNAYPDGCILITDGQYSLWAAYR
jgi:N-acetylglucosamine-6-phosphate deacetylase